MAVIAQRMVSGRQVSSLFGLSRLNNVYRYLITHVHFPMTMQRYGLEARMPWWIGRLQ